MYIQSNFRTMFLQQDKMADVRRATYLQTLERWENDRATHFKFGSHTSGLTTEHRVQYQVPPASCSRYVLAAGKTEKIPLVSHDHPRLVLTGGGLKMSHVSCCL